MELVGYEDIEARSSSALGDGWFMGGSYALSAVRIQVHRKGSHTWHLEEYAEKAAEFLAEDRGVEEVKAHWRSIVDGVVPFRYKISDKIFWFEWYYLGEVGSRS